MTDFLSDVSRRAFVRKLAGGTLGAGVGIGGPLGDLLGAQGVTAGSPTSSGALPFSLPSPGGIVAIVAATADAVLRGDAPGTNEGANPRLRVGINPITRAVVRFDYATVFSRLTNDVKSVYLVLTIATNHNNWGQADDRVVDCHPLLEDFVEGNGAQLALPGGLQRRGIDSGATWDSPEDPDCSDTAAPDGLNYRRWTGGSFDKTMVASSVHLNQMSGEVAFDVTSHVIAGCSAWLIKVRQEDPVANSALTPGFEDNYGGTVEYISLQGIGDVDGKGRGPELRFSSLSSPADSALAAFAPLAAPDITPGLSVSSTPIGSLPLTPVPSLSQTPVPSLSQTPVPSLPQTSLPAVSASPTPAPPFSQTQTPKPSSSTTPTPKPSQNFTPTPDPSQTQTLTPTATASPTPTATISPTPTATASPTPTATISPTPTATVLPTPTPTVSPTPSATVSPTPTATVSPTPTATVSPTPTPTASPTPTSTPTPTPSASAHATPTPTPRPTPKPTPTPSKPPKPSKKPKGHDHDHDRDDHDHDHDRDDHDHNRDHDDKRDADDRGKDDKR